MSISSWYTGAGGSGGASATNTITTQNLNPTTGVPTAHSTVSVPIPSVVNAVSVVITGTWTCVGGLIPQFSSDNTNWVTLSSSTFFTYEDGTQSATIGTGATGVWECFPAGPGFFRVSANGAVTGTATVTLNAGPAGGGGGGGGGSSSVTIIAPIGQKAMAASVSTVIASDQSAVPVTVSGPTGRTTASASIPVVLNSDQDTRPASGNMTVADTGSSVSGNTVTGTATTGSTYTLAVNGQGTCLFEVSGTWSATLVAEIENPDGTTFTTNAQIYAIPLPSSPATTITANGLYRVNAHAGLAVRIRIPSGDYTSGTVVVQGVGSANSSMIVATTPLASTPALTVATLSTSSSGAVTLVAAQGGSLKIYPVAFLVTVNAATNVYLEDDPAGGAAAMSETWYFAANGGVSVPAVPLPGGGWVTPFKNQAAGNKILAVNNSAAVAISCRVLYYVA